MKTSAFIIFFSIVISIYSLINLYIYIRGLQCFLPNSNLRNVYKISFVIIVSSFILSRILERYFINLFTTTLTWVGSFWLAAMFYFLLTIIFFDLIRLANHFIPFYPAIIKEHYQKVKLIIGISTSIFISFLLIIGYLNTINTKVRKINITINKKITGNKTLHIVCATDIHLGTIINKNRATYLVNKINSLQPDIIIFAGDILDEVLAPVLKYNIGGILTKLNAPLGVYAITGNHEYIGGIEPAVKYLSEHNITLIRDTALFIDNRFYLIGREDRDKPSFTSINRKSLKEITKDIDKTFPLILLDHQPFDLKNSVQNGIDLQLSGHTHHAQIWPLSYLTQKIYELDWGYKKIGNSNFYVSCGFGTWGPPVRLGSHSEIVDINITFD